MMQQQYRDRKTELDAEDIGFWERSLQFIKTTVYETEYADLKAADGTLFPISTQVPPWAKEIVWREFDKVGMAKIVNSYAQDFPNVEIKGRENVSNIRRIGASYRYDWDEIMASRQVGLSLDQRRALATRRANDERVDKIAFEGDDEYKLPGLFNNTNIPVSTVLNDGTGATTEWVNKTPLQILRDMNDGVSDMVVLTKEKELPDTLLLPTAQFELIGNTVLSSATSITTKTIKQQFLDNQSYIKQIISVPKLAGAGSGGEDVMVIYKMDIEKLSLEIPEAYNQLAPQQKVMEFKVPVTSKCGGLLVYKPLSVSILEGI
jgi:hypothetical protein